MAGKLRYERKRPRRFAAFILVKRSNLLRDDVCGAGAFFALAYVELDRLALLQLGVSAHLDFRMMNEEILAAIIGNDKPKTLFTIEPLYFTSTHATPSAKIGLKQTFAPQIILVNIPEGRAEYSS
jgi:hypothetical protein